MKTRLVISGAVLALIVSGSSNAEWTKEHCVEFGEAAEFIMEVRQAGGSRERLEGAVTRSTDSEVYRGMLSFIVAMAFNRAIETTPEAKQAAIDQFAAEIEKTTCEAIGEN